MISIERTGNATITNHTLVWNVTFSEWVNVGTVANINRTNVANATIPDLGTIQNTMLVGVPGNVTGGSVAVNLTHPIRSGLVIELVAPNCTGFTIHNQTHVWAYELLQPHSLEGAVGMEVAGPWTLVVSDMAKWLVGTLNSWSLVLWLDVQVPGAGNEYTFTQYVGAPGNHTLNLDAYDIRDRAGNPLADGEPDVNEPYEVIGIDQQTC